VCSVFLFRMIPWLVVTAHRRTLVKTVFLHALTSILRTVGGCYRFVCVGQSCVWLTGMLSTGVYPFAALGLRPHGGIDAKVTSSQLFKAGLSTSAISGPTYDYLPPFQFSTSPFANLTHEGMPDLWQFPWMTIQF
jgi:hypothetical protein